MTWPLPVEITGRVLQLVVAADPKRSQSTLLPLLMVSSTFRTEAERILYASILLKSLPQVVKCFSTLVRRPNLARLVRSLTIAVSLDSTPVSNPFNFLLQLQPPLPPNMLPPGAGQPEWRDNKQWGRVSGSFGRLVTRTLAQLSSLQDYSLTLGGLPGRDEQAFVPIWLPANAPFQLRRFICDLNVSPTMKAFLLSQPSITDLLMPYISQDRMPLSPTALPDLKGVVSTPFVTASIVPNRPVRRVCLKDDGLDLESFAARVVPAFPELAKSTAAIKHIEVTVAQMKTVVGTILQPLAMHLPQVETIVLRQVIGQLEELYEAYSSEEFAEAISLFPNLKHLGLPGPPPLVHLSNANFQGVENLGMSLTATMAVHVGGPPPGGQAADNPVNGGPPGGLPPPHLFNMPPMPGGMNGGVFNIPLGPIQLVPPQANGQPGQPAQPGPPGPMPANAGNLPPLFQQLIGLAVQQAFTPPVPVGVPGAQGNNPAPQGGPITFAQSFVLGPDGVLQPGPIAQNPPAPDTAAPVDLPNPTEPHPTQEPVPPPPNPIPQPADAPGPVPPGGNPMWNWLPFGGLFGLGGPQGVAGVGPQQQQPPATQQGNATDGMPPLDDQDDLPPLVDIGPIITDDVPLDGSEDGEDAEGDEEDNDEGELNPPADTNVDAPPPPGLPAGIPPLPIFGTRRRGRKAKPDPKVIEILENGRRGLKDKELIFIDKWKTGGFAPKLKTVTFDMDTQPFRTFWTWKKNATRLPIDASLAMQDESDVDSTAADIDEAPKGAWEVEYSAPPVF